MTTIIEKVFDLLLAAWHMLVPWVILPDDERGLVRRLGVTRRALHPGWNWKLPLVERALTCVSALDSHALREQSLTTRDGVQVTLRGVLTYRVVDPYKWIVLVNEPESVLNDAGCIAISRLVPQYKAAEVLGDSDFLTDLTRHVRRRAKKFGIEVEAVGLADRTAAPTYRLMGVK